MDLAAVSIGAVGGALARYQITKYSQKNGLTPWSTCAINVLGSTILGGVAGRQISPSMSLLIGTGFCGSFTTFSTFSVDTVLLLEKGLTGRAIAYVAMNNILSISAAGIGYKLARNYFPPRIL